MPQLTIVVSGPDLVLDLVKRALDESAQVTIAPKTIFPGYVLDVVTSERND